ncbi:uncharacterized protein LKV04_022097 [Tautogolabrus adspersus]
MANNALLHFLCVSAVFHKGLNSVIQTQKTVTAAVGDQACLNCRLIQTEEVHQVTWQKMLPDGERTVATDNWRFGQRVDPYFSGKVEFRDAGLQNSSIVIREVTEQDEGCYRCLFNTYPRGALIATTCLQVYELHEPVLHIRESNSSEEVVVSCSATGRPAPTATITVPHQELYFLHNTSDWVTNNNGTVTVTKTAELSRPHDNSTQVGCTVGVLYGAHKAVFKMIPEVKKSPPDEKPGANNSSRSEYLAVDSSKMAQRAVILSLLVLAVSQKAPAALIQTQQTVMAAVGDQACLNCWLVKSKEVHQVTWQKILPDGERNVGTYSKYSIKRVNTGFQGKVEFRQAGLQNSSIVIRNVTEQDEGCYRCLFNTYPDGALICSTCLKLYELHGPFLHVRESNSSEEVVVSCSATGRPAPTVTLSVLHHKLHFSTHSHKNTNGTVTVSTESVLRRNYDNSTQVECEVKVPSVPLKKDSVMIPAGQQSPPGLLSPADFSALSEDPEKWSEEEDPEEFSEEEYYPEGFSEEEHLEEWSDKESSEEWPEDEYTEEWPEDEYTDEWPQEEDSIYHCY